MQALLVLLIVIGLPVIGGLLLAAYYRWLRHKERTPISPQQLYQIEKELQELRSENQQLRQRVQNLETIVASVDWDQVTAKRSSVLEETYLPVKKQILNDD